MAESTEIVTARALRDIASAYVAAASALDPPPAPTAVASRQASDAATRSAIGEDAGPWLNKRQAAAYLGVTTRCIVNWQRDRGLPYNPCGGINLYLRSELDQWVIRGGVKGEAA